MPRWNQIHVTAIDPGKPSKLEDFDLALKAVNPEAGGYKKVQDIHVPGTSSGCGTRLRRYGTALARLLNGPGGPTD